LDKTGRAVDSSFEERIELAIGHAVEPVAAEWYTKKTGEQLSDPKRVFVSKHVEWQLASPDRIRASDGNNVECKHSLMAKGWGDEGTDDVPGNYICQTQWQMDVLDCEFTHIAAIVGGRFRLYTVCYDAELCEGLREVAARFWTDHVLADVQPDVSASDCDKEYLQERFKLYSAGEMLTAEFEIDGWAAELHAAVERYDAAKTSVDVIKNRFRQLIGTAEGIQGDGWKCTWKTPRATTVINWEAVAKELGAPPDLIAKHTSKRANSRRFLFTPSKNYGETS
jgi:predicted phage-related endonuclease